MERKVILSRTAEQQLEKLLVYLVQNWSAKVKTDFVKKLDKAVSLAKSHPESFPLSENRKELRKCVITKHTTLYFSFDDLTIHILTIFDNRQNPDKLKL